MKACCNERLRELKHKYSNRKHQDKKISAPITTFCCNKCNIVYIKSEGKYDVYSKPEEISSPQEQHDD